MRLKNDIEGQTGMSSKQNEVKEYLHEMLIAVVVCHEANRIND